MFGMDHTAGVSKRLRTALLGVAGTSVLALGAVAPADAGTEDDFFKCRATGLTIAGNPIPPTVAGRSEDPPNQDEPGKCVKDEEGQQDDAHRPGETQDETAAPLNIFVPEDDPETEEDERQLRIQTFYARTEKDKGPKPRWVQSYSAAAVVQLGSASGPHILIEGLESSATASCKNGKPRLVSNGGVLDVHIRQSEDDERVTVVNVGNGYDFVRVPGLGVLEFNRTEREGNKITRTAVVLTDERDVEETPDGENDEPVKGEKVLEISKTEAGFAGNPCKR